SVICRSVIVGGNVVAVRRTAIVIGSIDAHMGTPLRYIRPPHVCGAVARKITFHIAASRGGADNPVPGSIRAHALAFDSFASGLVTNQSAARCLNAPYSALGAEVRDRSAIRRHASQSSCVVVAETVARWRPDGFDDHWRRRRNVRSSTRSVRPAGWWTIRARHGADRVP